MGKKNPKKTKIDKNSGKDKSGKKNSDKENSEKGNNSGDELFDGDGAAAEATAFYMPPTTRCPFFWCVSGRSPVGKGIFLLRRIWEIDARIWCNWGFLYHPLVATHSPRTPPPRRGGGRRWSVCAVAPST